MYRLDKEVIMRNLFLVLALFSIAACSTGGSQSTQADQSTQVDLAAYKAFGEKAGIKKIVDDMFVVILKDPRIKTFFAETDNEYIKQQLTDQFCDQLNGPCEYTGVDMKSSHVGLNIGRQHFNALVEALRISMDQNNVPFRMQNQLLVKLAPMHKDIIEE